MLHRVPHTELTPTRNPDGTITLRAVELGLVERVRRWVRRQRGAVVPRTVARDCP
jgi:hypothetical protein